MQQSNNTEYITKMGRTQMEILKGVWCMKCTDYRISSIVPKTFKVEVTHINITCIDIVWSWVSWDLWELNTVMIICLNHLKQNNYIISRHWENKYL